MKTLLSHRSIRKYQNRPIEKEILDEILKAVQAAPNWVNLQHISVIVVQEQQRREKFAELCGGQKHIAQAPVFLVFCADFYRTWLACKEKGQEFDSVVSQIDNLIVGANEVGIALGTAVPNPLVWAPYRLGTSGFMLLRRYGNLICPNMLCLCLAYVWGIRRKNLGRNPVCRKKQSALRKNIIPT